MINKNCGKAEVHTRSFIDRKHKLDLLDFYMGSANALRGHGMVVLESSAVQCVSARPHHTQLASNYHRIWPSGK